jgi:mRNA interferase RelE/StbE
LYRIRIAKSVKRDVDRLPGHMRQRVRAAISSLALTPRPAGARALRDAPGRYRIRLDPWRIIYRLGDQDRTVVILAVRQKRGPETYRES